MARVRTCCYFVQPERCAHAHRLRASAPGNTGAAHKESLLPTVGGVMRLSACTFRSSSLRLRRRKVHRLRIWAVPVGTRRALRETRKPARRAIGVGPNATAEVPLARAAMRSVKAEAIVVSQKVLVASPTSGEAPKVTPRLIKRGRY